MLRMMRILSPPIDPLRSATSTISIGARPSSSTWLAVSDTRPLSPCISAAPSCVFWASTFIDTRISSGGLTISNVSDMISCGVEVCECVLWREKRVGHGGVREYDASVSENSSTPSGFVARGGR